MSNFARPEGVDMSKGNEIQNPGPVRWPWPPEWVTPDMEGPMPGSMHPCGCHLRRPDYKAVLCPDHLAELNADAAEVSR